MSGANGDEQDGHVEGGVKPLTAFDPERIGPYRLLGRLGAGGMGRVYLARSKGGRTVAVKVVHEEHVADEQFRARFRREINAARKVGERYTAPVLDADPEAEAPWVATGYVPGLSLEQVVRRHGPLGVDAVQALADGLLRALKDVHDAGIVHRDLKPSNVMLTVDGTRIIDFGIARALEASVESLLTSTGMVIGSPGFMSPEQILGQRAEPKSDVFTLGCVLTYAATGHLPFGHGASNQHAVMYQITHKEPDLTGLEDPGLRALVEQCLNKDPEQRPDVDELLAAREGASPTAAEGSWLPADVVALLAQRSARLLDVEAVPLREERAEPVDRATVGLPPPPAAPKPVPPGAVAVPQQPEEQPEKQPEERSRRRRTFVVLPILVVLAAGGGTVAFLQPFGGNDGGGTALAQAPGSSTSATPGGGSRPSGSAKAGSPPSTAGKGGNGAKGSTGGQKPQGSGGSSGTPVGAGPSGGRAGTGGGSGSSGTSGTSGSSGGSRTSTSPRTSAPPVSIGGGSSSSGGSSTGSRPPNLTTYRVAYNESCFGACSMPLTLSWSAISRATRYDIAYTNKGSQYTSKNVDTIYSTGKTTYTINGPYSGDNICVKVRAANKYGASTWAQTWCNSVPY